MAKQYLMKPHAPYIIGVTGGIGSGKSVVSRLLRLMGVPVYDCDSEAKRLMHDSLAIRVALTGLVGEGVYDSDGAIDKARLASFLFSSNEHAQMVNAIVHPVVRADFKAWAHRAGKKIVAVESAILFEAGMDADVNLVLAVCAPESLRLQRAVRRDKSNEAAIKSRMQRQMDEDDYASRAHHIILNDGAHSLIAQVASLLERLEKTDIRG